MNDLDLMKDFRADVAPADPVALARARAGMFRADTAGTAKARGRWVWRLAPAGALVAAVAGTAVAVRPGQAPESPPAVAVSPAERGPAPSEAARVLRLAAAEARRGPVLPARPGQFVYIRSRAAWAGAEGGRDDARYLPPVEHERRIWLSVDGSRDGLLRERAVRPGADPGRELGEVPLTGGRGIAAYRADLPVDARKMRAWLYAGPRSTKPGGNSPDTTAWTKVGDTLREQYVTPASVAALFDAAATIPGTGVVRQTDLAGRRGTAVSRTERGIRHDLIFDATTYRFLGERDVVVGDAPPFPRGAVVGWTAQLEIAVVDRAGQLP